MNELDAVSGVGRHPIQPSGPTTATRAVSRPNIDTETLGDAAPLSASSPTMPAGSRAVDYTLARSAMRTIGDNVAVDFAHVAALMMQIDSEIARATRDSEVEQIRSVADEMHASADHVRESAKLALAGGVVSGATQIGAAGLSIGGGIQGMRLTANSAAMEPAGPAEPTVKAPSEPAAATGPATNAAAAPETAPSAAEQPRAPAETEAETVREETSTKQKMAARRLDHTVSQQLSARSQNVALMTEGLSKLSTATGEMIRSALDYEARQEEADGKDTDARAEEMRAYLERTKAFADAMQKGTQDMLQMYQQMDESVHQTSKAVWSRA